MSTFEMIVYGALCV